MRSSGKLVVLSIFVVAIAMASFALWWNWGLSHRSLDFWGKEGGLAIRDGERIELLRLRPKTGRIINLEGFDIVETKDVSKAPGVLHARHSLLQDASFDWTADLGEPHDYGKRDHFAVRFSHQKAVTTILFIDSSFERIVRAENGDKVTLSPKARDGWKLFIRRYFPSDASLAPAPAE
ncbi:MAG: hypothetical protein ACR2FY_02400 [Pirellulaceae bacterium]